jgi:hypothetical protein
MNKISLIILLTISLQSFSQGYTKKDFKLLLDNYIMNDSTKSLKLTRNQLLNAKQLHTNMTWAKIQSFIVYTGGTEVETRSCNGAELCKTLKEQFNRVGKGYTVTFEAKVVNPQGKNVEWNDLSIVIVE